MARHQRKPAYRLRFLIKRKSPLQKSGMSCSEKLFASHDGRDRGFYAEAMARRTVRADTEPAIVGMCAVAEAGQQTGAPARGAPIGKPGAGGQE